MHLSCSFKRVQHGLLQSVLILWLLEPRKGCQIHRHCTDTATRDRPRQVHHQHRVAVQFDRHHFSHRLQPRRGPTHRHCSRNHCQLPLTVWSNVRIHRSYHWTVNSYKRLFFQKEESNHHPHMALSRGIKHDWYICRISPRCQICHVPSAPGGNYKSGHH